MNTMKNDVDLLYNELLFGNMTLLITIFIQFPITKMCVNENEIFVQNSRIVTVFS